MAFQLSLNTEQATAAYPADLLVISSDVTVREAVELMRAQRTSCLLVCDRLSASSPEGETPVGSKECTLLGIYTERDALKWMAAGCPADIPITDAMSGSPVTLSESESVGMSIQKMAAGGYRHLPIVSAAGTPTSIATVQGLVHYLVEHFPETIYNLPPTLNSGPSEREGA